MNMEKTPHIAILPSPGMGHLIPMAEFAKRLVEHHHISATIIIPTTGTPPKAQTTVLESLPEKIHHMFLSPVNNLPENVRPEIKINRIMQGSLSSLRDALSCLKSKTKLVALVFDMFGHDSMEVAKEFNLCNFLFFPMSAMALSFTFTLQKLDEETTGEYKDLTYPVKVPGSVSFHGRELMAPVQIRTDEVYKGYLLLSKRLTLLDGIMVNSFEELEEETIRVLRDDVAGQTPIYPIGPLIRSDPSNGSDRHECLKWLDDQPSGSVMLVSFGSGGTLSLEQIHELAHGLEMSNHRFLWIVRSPSKASNASFFTGSSLNDPLGFLPEGFLARTVNRGFIVPMIAWPLYAEQHMNAKVMTEALDLALRLETDENGLYQREEIKKVVKELMEGDEGKKISKRLKELKSAAMKALSDGGSSMESLSKIALQLKK
ncbi:putative hydroquinone glucosyltransferase [Helianthus annuus]|nr:putative hydroquinone glucosyltransferase [Helianthus annuus]